VPSVFFRLPLSLSLYISLSLARSLARSQSRVRVAFVVGDDSCTVNGYERADTGIQVMIRENRLISSPPETVMGLLYISFIADRREMRVICRAPRAFHARQLALETSTTHLEHALTRFTLSLSPSFLPDDAIMRIAHGFFVSRQCNEGFDNMFGATETRRWMDGWSGQSRDVRRASLSLCLSGSGCFTGVCLGSRGAKGTQAANLFSRGV